MPRTGRGGSRQGNPGTAYKNRTDLAAARQPVAAPSGQTYGERGRQESAQQQIPIPDVAGIAAAMPGLTDPSQRPGEPLTAGLPVGPGPGPEALAAAPTDPGAAGLLRRMLAVDQDPELFELVALADRARGGITPPR